MLALDSPRPSSIMALPQELFTDGELDAIAQMGTGDFPQDALVASKPAKIMLVDDEPLNIKLTKKYLSGVGYENFVSTTDPTQAMLLIKQSRPDVILLDVMMSQLSGLELLAHIRRDPLTRLIPVLMLTAVTDTSVKMQALQLGATDFLTKPIEPAELTARTRNVLTMKAHQDQLANYLDVLEEQVQIRTRQLAASRRQLITCLARAAEFRDNDTGRHVIRVGAYSAIIARQLNFDATYVDLLEQAAQLHDVGKIAVPDSVLLKPGKLDPEEFELVQRHCGIGRRIIEPLTQTESQVLRQHTAAGASLMDIPESTVLSLAASIAQTHHERWDGTGYPIGLAGEDIPIEGRIVAVADVFDALSSKRPYKPAFPLTRCLEIMQEGSGKHFDPRVLDAFKACRDEVVKVQMQQADLG